MLSAVINRFDEVVTALIANGANNLNTTYHFYSYGSTAEQTLLHIAASIPNNGKVIKAHITGGAKIDVLANYDNTRVCCISPPVSEEHSAYLQK